MNRFLKLQSSVLIAFGLVLAFAPLSAERIRLDRESGVVNKALQEMLSEQIANLNGGVGKLAFGLNAEAGGDCSADLFVSPDTVYAVVEMKKAKSRTEFYVDHPYDSFKDILFQALVKQGEQTELSVDKKSSGYKFIKKGNNLDIVIKQGGDSVECKFNLAKAELVSGATE